MQKIEKLFQSVALVQNVEAGSTRWFLRWQPYQKCWQFVVGERLERESFRETVLREVAWQLNLNRKTDFLVSNMAQLSMEFTDRETADKSDRQVAVAFYQVQVYRRSALDLLNATPTGCWVSAAEICAGETTDGQLIQPQIVGWLNQWQIIHPWQE